MSPRNLIAYLFPRQVTVSHGERILSSVAAFFAIILTALASSLFLEAQDLPFLVAPMGASAVLLFGAPHNPVSQPWPLLGGHLVSVLVGIVCAQFIPGVYLASASAVALAILIMFYLRCLHPPGGGTALLPVLGSAQMHQMGYQFITMPVVLNALLLLAMALLVNNLLPGRRYPFSLSLPGKKEGTVATADKTLGKLSFDQNDLLAALRNIGGYIDVTGEDLNRIYSLATLHAHRRKMGEVRCSDVMSRNVITANPDTGLETVWTLLKENRIRGVPVVEGEHVVGMLAIADFLKQADWRMRHTPLQQLKLLLRGQSEATVAQIMASPAITVSEDTHILDLFTIFSENGINHLPVLNNEGHLTGIVTRLDLLGALVGDVVEEEDSGSSSA